MFTKSYTSRHPLEFSHCYKCGSAERLATTSVDTSRRSILDLLFIWLRFFGMLTNRERITLPICTKCRSFIWIIRVVHLALIIACLFAFKILAPIVGQDDARLFGGLVAVFGPFLLLVSYMIFRDRFLGVVAYPNERSYKYVVSRRFIAKIEEEFELGS